MVSSEAPIESKDAKPIRGWRELATGFQPQPSGLHTQFEHYLIFVPADEARKQQPKHIAVDKAARDPSGTSQPQECSNFLGISELEFSNSALLSWTRTSEEDQPQAGASSGGETCNWEQFIDYDWQTEYNPTPCSGLGSSLDPVAAASEQPGDEQDFQTRLNELFLQDLPNTGLQYTVPHEEVKDHGNGFGVITQHSFSNSIIYPPSFFGNSNIPTIPGFHEIYDTTWLVRPSQSEGSESVEVESSPMTSASSKSGDCSKPQDARQAIRLERLVLHACIVCSRRFSSKEALGFHENKSHTSFACNVPGCRKDFWKKRDLDRHSQAVHGPSTILPCGKRIGTRKDNIRRHRRSCKLCRDSFSDVDHTHLSDMGFLLDETSEL